MRGDKGSRGEIRLQEHVQTPPPLSKETMGVEEIRFREPIQAPTPPSKETIEVVGRYDSANPSKHHHHRHQRRQWESRGDTIPRTHPSTTTAIKGDNGEIRFREPIQAPPPPSKATVGVKGDTTPGNRPSRTRTAFHEYRTLW